MKPLTSIAQIKAANKAAGKFYFSPDTMRFFDSRVLTPTWAGRGRTFFITSEQFHGSDGADGPRLYTVRVIDWATAEIKDVGEFQAHQTPEQAYNAARDAAVEDLKQRPRVKIRRGER